ncbi:MAG: hypothetical protein Q4D71_04900 [Oscillospiraceae bacterium]|nr:hypothetical protein [Oscillospiraceae bacterium]
MTTQQIETSYRNFIEDALQGTHPSQVEYFGINFHEQRGTSPIFKCYYSTEKSLQDADEILQPFFKRDMIHALNRIKDTHHSGKFRYEIGLRNRNDENMLWMYKWIRQSFALSQRQQIELEQMKQWTCCSQNTYRYAALYYLGFITNEQRCFPLEAIKPHYILRTCEDPEKIGKNYSVDTKRIIEFLKALEIPAFTTLAGILSPIVGEDNELWMAAMDFFARPSTTTKYKIYLKDRGGILLSALENIVLSLGLHVIAEQLAAFATWLDGNEELELYGVAMCLTEDGKWSVNCYL